MAWCCLHAIVPCLTSYEKLPVTIQESTFCGTSVTLMQSYYMFEASLTRMMAYVCKYKRVKDTWHQIAAYTELFSTINYYSNSKSLLKLHPQLSQLVYGKTWSKLKFYLNAILIHQGHWIIYPGDNAAGTSSCLIPYFNGKIA